MTRMKKLTSVLLAVVMAMGLMMPAWASIENIQEGLTAEETVYAVVNAENMNDWNKYLSFMCTEERVSYEGFINDPENVQNHIGLFNIKSAEITEIKELPLNEMGNFIFNYSSYEQQYKKLATFLVGINYETYEEDKYHFNGVNYRLFVLGMENGRWCVLEMSDAPLKSLTLAGLSFNSTSEMTAQNILDKREMGIIINADGELLDVNGIEEAAAVNILSGTTRAAVNDHVCPTKIIVFRQATQKRSQHTFDYYIRNVLPNEWYPTWPYESLKAGAMGVKMIGWYFVYSPKYPDKGADVDDSTNTQVFIEGTAVSSTNQAINNTTGIGLEQSTGELLLTPYRDGTNGQPGTQSSGIMSQWGTKYWAEKGTKNYLGMLHYYYDNSPESPGVIRTFSY